MPFLRFSDNHHVGAVAFGRAGVDVRPVAPMWTGNDGRHPFRIRVQSPRRGGVLDVVQSRFGVGARLEARVLVDGMQLVAFVLRASRPGIRDAAQGRFQLRGVQEFLVEGGQEGFQTRKRGRHEAVVQHHLSGDDDVDAIVSRVRIGEDVFEIDDPKHGGEDDSDMVLASKPDSGSLIEDSLQESG